MKRAVMFGVLLGMLVGCGDNTPADVDAGQAMVPQCALPMTEDPAAHNVGSNTCFNGDAVVMRTLSDGRAIPLAECVTDTAPVKSVANDCEWKNVNTVTFDVWCGECP